MLFEFWRLHCNSWLREDLCRRIRILLHILIVVTGVTCLSGSLVIDYECPHQVFILGRTPLFPYLYHRYSDLFNCVSFNHGPRYLSVHNRLLNNASTLRDCG